MKKKLLSWIMILSILTGLLGAVPAQAGDDIYVTTGGGVVEAGETFSLEVFLDFNSGIAGAMFDIVYDHSVLTLLDAAPGPVWSAGNFSFNSDAELVQWYDSGDNMTGEGVILELTFRANPDAASGDTAVNLQLTDGERSNLIDTDANAVDCTFIAGTVTVRGSDVPDPAARLTVTGNSTRPGETVEISLEIAQNPGISQAAFVFYYDHDALELVRVRTYADDLWYDGDFDVDWDEDLLTWTYPGNQVAENGTLIHLTFEVAEDAEPGDYEVSMTLANGSASSLTDKNGNYVQAEFIPGTVTVGQAVLPPDPGSVNIVVGNGTDMPGHYVYLPVTIQGNPGLAGAMFDLIYDLDSIWLEDVLPGDVLSEGSFTYNYEDDIIQWYSSSDSEIAYDDGELFTLVFRVLNAEEGYYPVSVELEDYEPTNLVDKDSNPIPAVFYDGGVQVVKHVGLDNFVKVKEYQPFEDVPSSKWYAQYVQLAVEIGLVEGKSATIYGPNDDIKLSETIALACRMHNIYYGGTGELPKGEDRWYWPSVEYAIENGIIRAGEYDNYSRPATRREFAAILAHCIPEEELPAINLVEDNAIPDVAVGDFRGEDIYMLYRAGILEGNNGDGTFNPESRIKRSEVAAIIVRLARTELRKRLTLTVS